MKRRLKTDSDARVARIWREVIYQALRDMRESSDATRAARAAARRFMFDDPGGVFSLVCRAAGLDPDDVRAEARKREHKGNTC